jgi:hypothetical protein
MTYTMRWHTGKGWTKVHLVDKDSRSTRCGRPLPQSPLKYEVGIPASDKQRCLDCDKGPPWAR